MKYFHKQIATFQSILHFLLVFVLFLLTSSISLSAPVFALPVCQVLDKSASRLDITLNLFGDIKKTKVDKIKAFLWIDPENPEGANLAALLEPHISKLFGNFEDNPLLIGMIANFLDKHLIFRSVSVAKRNGEDNFKVKGLVTSGNKKYPADFNISLDQIGRVQSRFSAKVESKNFQEILGMPGSAKGDFDLLFRAKPELSKELCSL